MPVSPKYDIEFIPESGTIRKVCIKNLTEGGGEEKQNKRCFDRFPLVWST